MSPFIPANYTFPKAYFDISKHFILQLVFVWYIIFILLFMSLF